MKIILDESIPAGRRDRAPERESHDLYRALATPPRNEPMMHATMSSIFKHLG